MCQCSQLTRRLWVPLCLGDNKFKCGPGYLLTETNSSFCSSTTSPPAAVCLFHSDCNLSIAGSLLQPLLPIARKKESQSQDGSLGAAVTPIIINAAATIFPHIKSIPGLPDILRKRWTEMSYFLLTVVLTVQGSCPTHAISHQCDQLSSHVLGREEDLPAPEPAVHISGH